MALSATVYRVNLSLSDVDRGVYETLELRPAQHPSESTERLTARILAYALLYEEGLEFGRGVSNAEEPALWTHDLTGQLTHWIDVGTPSADRIHAASKRAGRVSIVCHKGEEALARELRGKKIHKADSIAVLFLEPGFVATVAASLGRSADWTLVLTEGQLSLTQGEETLSTVVNRVEGV